jgi:hypothetical protein
MTLDLIMNTETFLAASTMGAIAVAGFLATLITSGD